MTAATAMPGSTASTFPVHRFAGGLECDSGFVIERFRALACDDIRRSCPAGRSRTAGARRRALWPRARRSRRCDPTVRNSSSAPACAPEAAGKRGGAYRRASSVTASRRADGPFPGRPAGPGPAGVLRPFPQWQEGQSRSARANASRPSVPFPLASGPPSRLARNGPRSGPPCARSFRPARRSRQHNIVVIEGRQELRVPDKLGHAGRPHLAERPFEDRHAAIAGEPRREHGPVRLAHAAVDRGRQGAPAARLPSCATALGAPMHTVLSPRRPTDVNGASQPIDTASADSASARDSSRRRRLAKRLRSRVSQNAQRTVSAAYSTAYCPCGSLNRLGTGTAASGVPR